MANLKRRTVLTLSSVGAAGAVTGYSTLAYGAEADPFQLGAASGDATTDSVILWTRLAPDPTAPDFGMDGEPDTIAVHWRIADSPEAVQEDSTSLYSGDVDALKKNAWSIHLEVKEAEGGGALEPGTRYYYQFSLPDESHATGVGETGTAPEATADVEPNFAVISCQSAATDADVNDGPSYWHGYTHLADNPVDFVLHLGDYIYRESHENTIPEGDSDNPCTELVDYRRRWGWYLERANIQKARLLNPIYAVPDDHEIYNNFRGGNIAPRFGEGTDWQLELFNHGMRAYWENMPLRGGAPTAPDGQDKVRIQLSRIGLNWGAHLDFSLLDTRQYRNTSDADSPTVLGSDQLAEVVGWIEDSRATWTVLGSTSPFSVYFKTPGEPAGPSDWTEYPDERERITTALADKAADGGNPVTVVGDVHCPFAAKVIRTYDPDSEEFAATEFSTPSMSSYGSDWTEREELNPEVFTWMGYRDDDSGHPLQPQPLKGYMRCSATADVLHTNFLTTHQTASSDGEVSSVAKFTTESGTIGAQAD